MTQHELDLLHGYLNGTLSETDFARLQSLLRESADARRMLRTLSTVETKLQQVASGNPETLRLLAVTPEPGSKPSTRWLAWRPLAAAAAGLVFGIFCTSVVFAYVAPSLGKVITLLQESFESGPAPLVTGVPLKAGVWSGDYTEVVGEQQGVKPEEGKEMLRFLRADYEGKANRDSSSVADVYRLIDLRPYREQFADGAAVVQFSAGFNAAAFPEGDVYMCKMSLHAYDAQTVAGGPLRVDDMREGNELAVAKAGGMRLDRDPATWQRVTGDLRLPVNADFIMAHISIHHARGPSPRGTFGGHYVDDVRLTMTRRPPLQ